MREHRESRTVCRPPCGKTPGDASGQGPAPRPPAHAGSRPLRYHAFGSYLKRRYGGPVRKIPLDAGFGCPHRGGADGRGPGGCIYCENAAFSPEAPASAAPPPVPVREQLARRIRARPGRRGTTTERYIAYFQAYTGTHAPVDVLRDRYQAVRAFPEVVGLAVGTRPDCADEPVLDLLDAYAADYEVWIEYGLQSAHDPTLERIGRGHTVHDFVEAVKRTARRRVLVCAHVILGLPGEGHAEMMETARLLASLPVHGVKLHHCHVVRGTPLAGMYDRGEYRPLEYDAYLGAACDFLERIPWPVTVQRLAGEAPGELLVAPRWPRPRGGVHQDVQRELARRGAHQGCRCSDAPPPARRP